MGIWGEGQDQIPLFDSTFMALAEVSQMNPDGSENPDGFVVGATWWTAFDWYTHLAPKSYQYMGLIHMNRTTEKATAARVRETYLPYYTSAGVINDVAGRDPSSSAAGVPTAFSLEQNYPNPFNPTTTIRYSLPVASEVKVAVFDVLGREVSVLTNGRSEAGVHEHAFDASDLSSGVYVCRLHARPLGSAGGDPRSGAGELVQSIKLLLVR
jgi:hypothetical protein